MKTWKVQTKYYYMNNETGELLTFHEMVYQGEDEYGYNPYCMEAIKQYSSKYELTDIEV